MQVRKLLGLASIALLGGLVGGCSTVQVHPVSVAQANNPSISGVRFFQPAPYLLVTQMPTHPQPMMLMMAGPHPHGPMAMRWGPKRRHGDFHGRHPADRDSHRHAPNRKHGRMKHQRPMMGRWMNGHSMPPPPPPMMAQQRLLCLQIIYLPDYSHPYVANLKGGLGHSKNSIVLANGWELLGINAKGHLTEPPPVRAITALPMMPPMGGPMPGPMAWKHHAWKHHGWKHHGKPMMHGRQARKMDRHGMHRRWMNHNLMMRHMMMMHRMMMSRQAAMAMGLHPGLYRFVFNAKTGRLECLQPVKFMAWHHHGHFHGGWKHHKKWHKKLPKVGNKPKA